MRLKLLTLKIESNQYLKPRMAEKIRGYFGNLYKDDTLFHQHTGNGKLIYHYPRIQYKVIEGTPYIIGLEEGVESLKEKFIQIHELRLDDKEYKAFEKSMKIENADLVIAQHQILYRFLSPWYALNQENYKKYLKTGLQTKRMLLLKRILIGNLLSLCKSLGEVVADEIVVGDMNVFEYNFNLDDVPILGFKGEFQVNFNIPDYLGLGKSVSRGFGTVVKIQNTEVRAQNTDNRIQMTE